MSYLWTPAAHLESTACDPHPEPQSRTGVSPVQNGAAGTDCPALRHFRLFNPNSEVDRKERREHKEGEGFGQHSRRTISHAALSVQMPSLGVLCDLCGYSISEFGVNPISEQVRVERRDERIEPPGQQHAHLAKELGQPPGRRRAFGNACAKTGPKEEDFPAKPPATTGPPGCRSCTSGLGGGNFRQWYRFPRVGTPVSEPAREGLTHEPVRRPALQTGPLDRKSVV